jgi:beta-carotene hydroxylase
MGHDRPTDSDQVPAWAARSDRALPHIDAPPLHVADPGGAWHARLGRLAATMLLRPVFGVVVFIAAALNGWWLVAVPAVWLVYGSTLTAVHHLIHGSLGLPHRARHAALTVLGAVVAESGHALQQTHLAHHRSAPDHPDPEGYIENVTWRQIPLAALRFRYRLAWWGLGHARRRRLIRAEMAFHAGAHLASLALLPITPLPWIYLTLIHVASFAFAVLAGKGPQTNWGRPIASPFVRVRTRVGRVLFFSHDLHLEHHIYPKVPLPRLRLLAPALREAYAGLDLVDVDLVV